MCIFSWITKLIRAAFHPKKGKFTISTPATLWHLRSGKLQASMRNWTFPELFTWQACPALQTAPLSLHILTPLPNHPGWVGAATQKFTNPQVTAQPKADSGWRVPSLKPNT